MYKTANEYYKQKYGDKVYKLSLDGGFTCPNRDGTIGSGGCIFCSSFGSGDFAEKGDNIVDQLEAAKHRVESKIKSGKYIAYFQAFTSTYASIEKLKKLYFEAIKPDYIVGLSIGTRPDCLGDDVVDLLKEINVIKPVCIELGLQTTNENSAKYIRRGYENAVYFDAVKRLRAAGIEVVTHVILGLPNETADDTIKTTLDAVNAGTDGVKFHLLHVLKNTDLEGEYLSGKFECLSLENYAEILKKCIAVLPSDVVVHRITGDGAKRDLVAPTWSADKKMVLNFLNKYLKED
ncbi:MAG: TIGR01212 family radical SAM protein [Clostridia bacterium]|nr:TIGR01212 family radical SAM protein [Clostridia bacterium]